MTVFFTLVNQQVCISFHLNLLLTLLFKLSLKIYCINRYQISYQIFCVLKQSLKNYQKERNSIVLL